MKKNAFIHKRIFLTILYFWKENDFGFHKLDKDRPDSGEHPRLMPQLRNGLAKFKDNFFGMSSSTSDSLLGYSKLYVTNQTKVPNLKTRYHQNRDFKLQSG